MKIVIVGNIAPPSAPHSVATEVYGVTPPAVVALDAAGNVVKTWAAGYSDAEVTAWANKTDKPKLTVYQFRSRFTQAEKEAIYTASATQVKVKVWLDDLASASEVDLNHQPTVDGVNALEAAGLIAVGRAAVILS